jgi:tetratricopeptide (TPR) repeat protein
MKPYCFILMPFGRKSDESGKAVEFDKVYELIIKPAVKEANLEPIRADEEIIGGIIHKPMFERLMLCDYAIADLTTANANVFYELGVRHGIRPHSTILTFAEGMRLPFDIAPLRALPYKLDSSGLPIEVDDIKNSIVRRLEECREPTDDSPVFQLVSDMPRPDIARLKTDTFRDSVKYSNRFKEKLKNARGQDKKAVLDVEKELGQIIDVDPGIIIDLFLSYRAVKDWDAMINLDNKMPPMLRQTILVQEQLGFAHTRKGNHEIAEKILQELIEKHGASSETNGILGRVYKDLWKKNKKTGNHIIAGGFLKKAIDTYLEGFEADWRDAYPGINAVTLMEITNPVDNRQKEILPVVLYSVKRRLSQKYPDYWDHATLLELNILSDEQEEAYDSLSNALTEIRERWEPESTAGNIELIIEAKKERNEEVNWIEKIYTELINASKEK